METSFYNCESQIWWSYDVWFLRYRARQTEFLLILDNFLHPLPPAPLTTHRNKILKKWKKTHGDIIILHKCTINDNHMIYGPWDMKCTRQNFFVILYHFLHHLEISFYTSVPGIMIIGYTVPEIRHVMDRIVIFYFGPATARKMKISKKWKKHLRLFAQVYQKPWSYAILFVRYGMWQM